MDEPALTVETVDRPEQTTAARGYHVRMRGALDLDSSNILDEHLRSLIASGATLIALDASDVDFMDSTGLRVIVATGNRLAEAGGKLLIEGVSGAVQRVLEITGLLERYQS